MVRETSHALANLGMTPDNEVPHQPSKRRKVQESCKVCRAKKTRCDGQRPICSPCTAKGITCEYNDVTVSVSVGVLADIEARLRKLERQATLSQSQSPAQTTVANALAIPVTPIEQSSHPQNGSRREGPPQTSSGDPDYESGLQFTDHPTTQFIQDITQIADITDIQSTAQLQASLWGKNITTPIETDTSSMVVPKRAIADDLLDCYETFIYPLFPVLHMPTFRKSYERLWEPQREGNFETLAAEVTFYATLNAVFALGCLNNSKVEPRLKLRTADNFYRRTRALLPLDALDIPRLGVVQCLLLTTHYLSFTKYSNRCCNTLAVAIRIAQTLGLHKAIEPSGSQLTREMNKRVWHHCLTLERLLSSIFGRKTMIEPDNAVPPPEKIDDEYLLEHGTGFQPAGMPSILDAFVVTIDIFEVIEGARRINYGSFTNGLRLPELTEVLQLNERIDQIEKNLPFHLKCDNPAKGSTPRDRLLNLQAEAVITRILHLRLVLLRPSVLVAARQTLMLPTPGPIPSHTEIALRTEVSTICVQAAISAIEMLHQNLRSALQIFSSTAVFVTLSAATILAAGSLVPELDIRLDDSSKPYGDLIAKALQVLDEHQWQIEGAPGAKYQLEKFLVTVNEARRRRNIVANQAFTAPFQNGGGQLSSIIEDAAWELDFSDPLLDFQWGGSAPVF